MQGNFQNCFDDLIMYILVDIHGNRYSYCDYVWGWHRDDGNNKYYIMYTDTQLSEMPPKKDLQLYKQRIYAHNVLLGYDNFACRSSDLIRISPERVSLEVV
jgi:hypothetical protein